MFIQSKRILFWLVILTLSVITMAQPLTGFAATGTLRVSGIEAPNIVHRAENLAALRGMVGTRGRQAVYLEGRTARGDGGDGDFRWDGSDRSVEVAADTQSGIYVAPNAALTGASGCWVRQDTEVIRVAWFGAGTAAAQGALSAANGQLVLFPGGTFISGALTVPNRCTIDLNGGTLQADPSTVNDLLSIQGDCVLLTNGVIDGNKTSAVSARHGVAIYGDGFTANSITVKNTKQDAFWPNDNYPAYGIGDYITLEHVTIENPGRNGMLTTKDTATYRASLTIRDLVLKNNVNANIGLRIEYVRDLTIDNIQATAGFAEKVILSFVDEATIQGQFIADDDLTNDLIDSTFIGRLTLRDSVLSGRRRGVGFNPSNTSERVTVINTVFSDVAEGIVGFENTKDADISSNKFYRCDIGVDYANGSFVKVSKNYFEDCRRPILLGANSNDGKINYNNLVYIIEDNTVNRTGVEAVQVSYLIGTVKKLIIRNNAFLGMHSVPSAFPAWGTYSPISNNEAGLLIFGFVGGEIGQVVIEGNNFGQDAAYQSGVAGGGCWAAIVVRKATQAIIRGNTISKNISQPIYISENTVGEFLTDRFVDSTAIDLSGAAYSKKGFPAMAAGNWVGYKLIYTEAASADAGINISIRDGISLSEKVAVATTPGAAAGTTQFGIIQNSLLPKGRNVEIYSPGGKVGAGEVYVRVYYIETE